MPNRKVQQPRATDLGYEIGPQIDSMSLGIMLSQHGILSAGPDLIILCLNHVQTCVKAVHLLVYSIWVVLGGQQYTQH